MSEVANGTPGQGGDSGGRLRIGQEVYYADGVRAGTIEKLSLGRPAEGREVYYTDDTPVGTIEAVRLGRRQWFTVDQIARVRPTRIDLRFSSGDEMNFIDP